MIINATGGHKVKLILWRSFISYRYTCCVRSVSRRTARCCWPWSSELHCNRNRQFTLTTDIAKDLQLCVCVSVSERRKEGSQSADMRNCMWAHFNPARLFSTCDPLVSGENCFWRSDTKTCSPLAVTASVWVTSGGDVSQPEAVTSLRVSSTWYSSTVELCYARCTIEDFQILTDFKKVGYHRHKDRINWFLIFQF